MNAKKTREGGDDSAPGGYGGHDGYANIRFVLEEANGETNAIHLIDGGENSMLRYTNSCKAYSLMGTEVGEGYRGIVIRNGKKVLVK